MEFSVSVYINYIKHKIVSLGDRSYLGLRQNSFMALTAVIKLF